MPCCAASFPVSCVVLEQLITDSAILPAANVGPSGGVSIINLLYINGNATYCCNNLVGNSDGSVTCPDGAEPFTIPDGKIIPGYAALANISSLDGSVTTPTTSANTSNCSTPTDAPSSSSTGSSSPSFSSTDASSSSSSSSSSRDIAIGAGVGVPLGVIALSAIAWALWERKQRQKALAVGAAVPTGSTPMMYAGQYAGSKERKAHPISELDNTERNK